MCSLTRRPPMGGPIITPGSNRCSPFHKLGKFCKVGSIWSSALSFSHKLDSLPSSSPSDGSSSNCSLQDSLRSERQEPSTRNSRYCKSIGVLERHDKPLDGLPQLPRVELANLNRNGISSKRIVKKHDLSKTTGSSKRIWVSANRSHRRIEKSGRFNERNVKYRVTKKKHNKRVSKPLPSRIGRRQLSKKRKKLSKRRPPVSASRRNKKSKLNDLFFYHAIKQEEPDIRTVEHAGVQGGGNNKREEEFNKAELKPLQGQDGQDVEVQSQQNEDTLCAKWKRMPTWKKTVAVVIPPVLLGIGIGTAVYLLGGANSNLSSATASHGNESINNLPSPIKQGMASMGVLSDVYPMNPNVQPDNSATLVVDQNENSSTVKNDKPTDVNHPNPDNGRTPSMEADGNSSTVKNDQTTTSSVGADGNSSTIKNDQTTTSLMEADGNSSTIKNDQTTTTSSMEADGNSSTIKSDQTTTSLMEADGNSSTVKNDKTTDVNHPNPDNGRTLLMEAAINGDRKAVKELIKSGASVDLADYDGDTALIHAVKNRRLEVAEELINSEADVDQKNLLGLTPLICAAENGHLQMVEKLIESKATVDESDYYNNGRTALMYAAENGHLQIVEKLINSEADVNHQDLFGWTPLMYAAKNGQKQIVEKLIKLGAKVDQKNLLGLTALDYAIDNAKETGYSDIKDLLRESVGKGVVST